jgi:hypothetical protein
MSGKVSMEYNLQFEHWVEINYPKIFSQWENEASELMDLDEWLYSQYPNIFRAWEVEKELPF